MVIASIGIGIVVGFIFYELVGLSPGGVVVPGYLALTFHSPTMVLTTIVVALITYLAVKGVSNFSVLYGRRRFMAMILMGFFIKWLLEEFVIRVPIVNLEIVAIGYIVPGLLANEMKRQGIIPTLICTGIVVVIVRLILYIIF